MSLNTVTEGNRLHIGIFGKRNSGKSSLINAITGQDVALVSDVAGTTTDPVKKAMEVPGVGPCMFIDTAGFDDLGELGKMRVEKTKKAVEKTDIAIIVFSDCDITKEIQWTELIRGLDTPFIPVLNKTDILNNSDTLARLIEDACGIPPLLVSAKTGMGIDEIRREIVRKIPKDYDKEEIVGSLAKEGDTVLLVIPQDIAAPKGRLILPQVQTLRELMDKKCVAICCTDDKIDNALSSLSSPPDLIITDSQVFDKVYSKKPKESKLTSFSILFARFKGDIDYFVQGAETIDMLDEKSKVLIAEACTHAPLEEDIGRVKIPALLRKKTGPGLKVDMVSGADFPDDLTPYNLIIHCGSCMFNRKHVLYRILQAKNQGVPMTNYGVTMAKLHGILDKVDY
ncbi:MAG TPA: [FeFe] hydrogenase H-cluster maturation GTPase HydF [Anaerovoracaceae bacterium]|nr:[FeFe] hydrogenase H-cluster maturation GTPase HydF [Anaerovoracaceae bacterium]